MVKSLLRFRIRKQRGGGGGGQQIWTDGFSLGILI